MAAAAFAQHFKRAERIETRHGGGGEAVSIRIAPEGRGTGQNADPVTRPDRIMVFHALGIMPHAVTIDDGSAGRFRNGDHAAIHMRGNTADHACGRRAQPFHRPVAPHQLLIAADAAGTDDDRRSGESKIALLFPAALLPALHGVGCKNSA
ncbi:hypothetical protein D3C71_569260 [compost metagenome]